MHIVFQFGTNINPILYAGRPNIVLDCNIALTLTRHCGNVVLWLYPMCIQYCPILLFYIATTLDSSCIQTNSGYNIVAFCMYDKTV